MSSNITSPSNTNSGAAEKVNASPAGKGKGKGKAVEEHTAEEGDDAEEDEEEEEEDDDDEEMEEDDDDEEDEEDLEEIDPSAIIGGRRTRGVKVDYTSKEALAKAGLKEGEGDESDDDVEMK